MSAEWIWTIGDGTDFNKVLKGKFLQGHREPRIALVGRSNVGKSSLINTLVQTRVARASNQPGKTRAIHFYRWNEAKKIVADLPGFGFAKVSAAEREKWAKFIQEYLKRDEALERAVVLLDSRHGPTPIDLEAIRFLSHSVIPMTFVFSKVDLLKTQSERVHRKREAAAALRSAGFDPDQSHWVSSQTKAGMNQLASALKSE